MLEKRELKKPKRRAVAAGGAPVAIATVRKVLYIAPTWALLLAKK